MDALIVSSLAPAVIDVTVAGATAVGTTAGATAFAWMPVWMMELITFVSVCAMVFGGVVPFIPQMLLIRRTRSCDGFNTLVCFNLMIANILRIMFWFGQPFELPLLAQSVLMVGTMLGMMGACVETYQYDGRRPTRLNWKTRFYTDFWQWTDYADYLTFVALFTVGFGLLTFLCLNIQLYVDMLGFMAVFVEAIQGLPQWTRNYQNKSTEGMSIVMVCCWMSGDTFKTTYFLLRNAPSQFALCGILQMFVDVNLLVQVFWYRGNREPVLPVKAAA